MGRVNRRVVMRWGTYCLLALGVLLSAAAAKASDIYIGQNPAGAGNGADCADARKVSSLAPKDWVAGNTIHLCGTITAGFSVQGSGTPGNFITIKWESGARISVAYGQMINLSGAASYLLFDGGAACGPRTACYSNEAANQTGYPANITGIIEATANGSSLPNRDSSTQAFYGCNGCHDIEIRNLIIRNLYVHSQASDSANSIDSGNFAFQYPYGATGAAGTISIHDSDLHDMGNAISIERGQGTIFNIYNLEMYHNNWAVENSGNGPRTVNIHDNHFHDAANWDTSSDTFHHNGLHNYMNVASDSLALNLYNNLSDGDWGACCTTATMSFTEFANPNNFNAFNNVDIQSCNNNTAPVFDYGATGGIFVNNTAIGCPTTPQNVNAFSIYGTNIDFRNNAIEGYGQYLVVKAGTTFTHLDYNVYGAMGQSGNAPWQCGSTGASALSAWQSACSGDAHGTKVSILNVTFSGVPQFGSPLLSAGINLTGLGILPLDSDTSAGNTRTPVGRPSTGQWAAGAYAAISSSALPAPPTGLTAAVN